MATGSFDLANVKALLSSGNPIIQSNGLTCLLSRLRLPFPNAKEKVSASSLFFDGFTKYGDAVAQWHVVANLLSHCAELSHRELQSLEVSNEDVFLIADNVLVNPLLVMNELFPACHVLLPALLSLYSSRSELAKSFPSLIPSEQLSKHGEERDIAFSLIQDLVTKFPTTFDAVKNLAIPGESDCLDLLKVKLRLMSTLCVSTDRSDELLPSLTRLLKKSAEVVGAAVSVVIILCKEEILDINSVRKQLSVMVRQPGFEVALMGYCEILAVAAQSGKCDDNISVEYVQELWEITQLRKGTSDGEDARRRAWTALGSFDFDLLKSAIPISGRHLVGQFLGLRQTERKGFAIFLHKIVSAEVESLSRSLYTKSHIHKTLLAPLVCNLHNSLGGTNQEAPWFWLATLPLFSVIVNEYSESEMKLKKIFSKLFLQVPLVENKLVNLFAGWRICISTFLNMETKGDDLLRCRDKIIEECKRSLKENELAVNNVVVVIAVLAGEMLRGRTENSRCVNVPLVRSAVWMICSLISNEIKNFYEDVEFNSILKWRLGIEEKPYENLHNFLAGEEFSAEISLSRSALWLLAAALGVEELVANSVSYSIPSDNSAEENMALFCSKNTIEPDDISKVLPQISNVTLSVFWKYERNFKKRLEQFSLNGGEESKRVVYEGLSHLSSISLLTKSIDLPSDYSHLRDDSVLRAVIEQFCAKSACQRAILHDLLPVLVDHVRSDGRHLPPLDLKIVLSAIDYRNDDEACLNMLRLAIQEIDQQVMYELTAPGYLDGSANMSPYLLLISQNLPLFLSFLPKSRAVMVLERLLKFAIQDDDVGKQILADIDKCGQQQDTQGLLFARWRYHWKKLSNICQFCEFFDMIADFLSACFLMDGLSASVVSAVKGMMLYISTSRPTLIRALMEDKSEKWEKLLTL
ncbi:unnamed protein product [Angiostrongylus costaricensis]|uniref:Signal recognition particle 14 kDa protein n=1 Tax=Angiostrongylus costaricensis TaxID=334426 RepID=A0A0R3PX75_ANGCS|nr:unnamed protein product [Angiostrongylus costaricensis]